MSSKGKPVLSFRIGMGKYKKLEFLAEDRDEAKSDVVNHAVNVYLRLIEDVEKLEEKKVNK